MRAHHTHVIWSGYINVSVRMYFIHTHTHKVHAYDSLSIYEFEMVSSYPKQILIKIEI